jgi:hypothetical protein
VIDDRWEEIEPPKQREGICMVKVLSCLIWTDYAMRAEMSDEDDNIYG